MPFFPTWRENPLFTILLFLIGLLFSFFLLERMYSSLQATKQLNEPTPIEHTIYVEGLGKATMIPDIAVMSFGIVSVNKSVAEAQKQNSSLMNTLIDKLKGAGIADTDLQTRDYNAYEKTEWNQVTQKSENVGWVVSQTLEVRIRDTQKISSVVEIAGQNGSTTINGPTFTVDDQSAYEVIAREKALANAAQKADVIAKKLNLKIKRVVSYSEYKEDSGFPQPYMKMEGGIGGGMMSAAPSIQTGTQELRLHATVTYLLEE